MGPGEGAEGEGVIIMCMYVPSGVSHLVQWRYYSAEMYYLGIYIIIHVAVFFCPEFG